MKYDQPSAATDLESMTGTNRHTDAVGVVAWSSGKDSACALHAVRSASEIEIVGLLTTLTDPYERVSMHGVRESILDAQAKCLKLPVTKVRIPAPCPNDIYSEKMSQAVTSLRTMGVTHMVFGDLFLEDVRDYRIEMLSGSGIEPVFPLWGRDTGPLAREMIAAGLEARLTCIDPRVIDRRFVGQPFDDELLAQLPDSVDPCGENGEFHTVVTNGPMFCKALDVTGGDVVERDGFVFADVILAPNQPV